jgi:hypothetical protein
MGDCVPLLCLPPPLPPPTRLPDHAVHSRYLIASVWACWTFCTRAPSAPPCPRTCRPSCGVWTAWVCKTCCRLGPATTCTAGSSRDCAGPPRAPAAPPPSVPSCRSATAYVVCAAVGGRVGGRAVVAVSSLHPGHVKLHTCACTCIYLLGCPSIQCLLACLPASED